MTDIYKSVLEKTKVKISRIEDTDEWLLVVINTMKAIICNSCRADAGILSDASAYTRTSQLQQLYDRVQGIYGREGFSYRHHPNYYYLSSLVAGFPDTELTDKDRDIIKKMCEIESFLLYEL